MIQVSQAVRNHLPETQAATVALRTYSGLGSGVIVSPDGLVLTAGHIAETSGRPIRAVLFDGSEVKGVSLGVSMLVDSGMIRLEQRDTPYPFVEVAPPGAYDKDDWCFALGHPDGYQEDRGQVLRIGRILSKRNYAIRSDCRLLGGDSGGPLFDTQGRVIGIHSRIGFRGDENFHAPMDSFHVDWDRLLAGDVRRSYDREERGFLGVQTESTPHGVRIRGVVKDSAAENAQLQIGDIIQSVEGLVVRDPDEFSVTLQGHRAADEITLHITREKRHFPLKISLGSWPSVDQIEVRDTTESEETSP